ncbi:MAG: phosphoenolpyruvate--protein phosphotransferase [Mycoplasma sp.]|nr:phosphoenolpyruvate--protein phosphotransferase [Mycoplasma sp.]
MMNKLNGIAASQGIKIAKAFILEEPKINIIKESKGQEKELNHLKEIVEETKKQLLKIKEQASKNLSAEEASVFDAHIQIVGDPVIMQEVEAMIKNENTSVMYALKDIFDKYHDTFANMDDAYFKERAADVKDVSKRMLLIASGQKVHDISAIDEEVVLIANDITPSETAQMNKKFVLGFATNIGGRTSHAAIMARSLEIPAVLGLKTILSSVKQDESIIIDGNNGLVIANPDAATIKEYENKIKEFEKEKEILKTFIGKESKTKDGHEVELVANIGGVNDVQSVLENDGEGIGLFRSEFLYMDASNWPSEEDQFNAYKTVVEKFPKNKRVIVRTLDIGGDKQLKYFKFDEEMNPFLGHRAVRFTLDKKDIFKTQLRALLRASAFGKISIMFPMIATIGEIKAARKVLDECKAELKKEKIAFNDNLEVGMMVEIPSAAIHADKFAKYVDFLSIGTNDLMQYSMAADRMNEKVSYLYQPLNPSILKLIKMTIDGGHKENIFVGMCGEMAGDPNAIPLLLGMGLDEFSMSATSILQARKQISELDMKDMKNIVDKILDEAETQEDVKKILETIK